MKILICHHIEPHWDKSLRKHGTSFLKLEEAVTKHVRRAKYDKVIVVRFETYSFDRDICDYETLYPYISDIVEYGVYYGNDYREEGFEHAYVSAHEGYAPIAEWMYNLREHQISICGAFDGQCVADLEACLNHLKIKYRRIEDLIV